MRQPLLVVIWRMRSACASLRTVTTQSRSVAIGRGTSGGPLVRSSLSTAGRRVSVLAAAALVSLTTAACGPADLQVGTAGATGQTASSQTATDQPVAIGDAATAPNAAVPTPAPTPTAPTPTAPAQTQPQAPVAEPTGSQVGAVDEQQAAVPTEVAPGAPQAAAPTTP